MFRAYLYPIIRRFTVCIQQLVRVVSFSCLSVGQPAQQSTKKHNTYQLLYIYRMPPDDVLKMYPKRVEVDWRNKLRINIAWSWFLLHRYMEMHGQQNIKCTDNIGIMIHLSASQCLLSLYVAVFCSLPTSLANENSRVIDHLKRRSCAVLQRSRFLLRVVKHRDWL